jgi:acyl-coenzyme A thioesterase PaaI-like protein
LTYMAAMTPVVTIEMSTTYIRPFNAEASPIRIKAEIVSKTKSLLVLRAEAHSKDGKLIATATNHSMVLPQAKLA